jgi:SAM-dependent methyltransferase
VSQPVFNAYSRYYDLVYRDKDYAAEAGYVRSLLSRYGVKSGDLLEFGSGTGKHGCLLAQHGYNVHGIERSAEMVAAAQLVPGFTCEQGDIATINMGRAYNAVLSLFHVTSYQTTNQQLQTVFANAAAHLNSGGLFIFDFWYSPAVYTHKPAVRVKRMADGQVEITRIAEPVIHANENRVDVHYTLFARELATGAVHTLQEVHPMRHFSLPEIDVLAESQGFERIVAEEVSSGKVPSEDTWGVCVILQKARP